MSSDDPAIRVNQVSKCYPLYEAPRDRLKQFILPRLQRALGRPARNYYQEFWALRDVSFEVRKGEAVGVIGQNGSGKSTLLQVVCGTLHPTGGSVQLGGRLAALLELGAGFNPEFTGRENVYLNGSILGLSQQQMDQRIGDIIDFSEIGAFVDRPVRMYSSGMFVRLAFAVQVFSQPEVLVVDEALSVGDIFFQQKCFAHIRALVDSGMTLLFVSHDMSAVRNLCDRAILLRNGEAEYEGSPEDVVSRFYAYGTAAHQRGPTKPGNEQLGAHAVPRGREDILRNDMLGTVRYRHGEGKLKLVAACCYNSSGIPSYEVEQLGELSMLVIVRAVAAVRSPSVGIHLYDRFNNLVFAAGTRQKRLAIDDLRAGETIVVELRLGLTVESGEYTFSLGCSELSSEGVSESVVQDRCEGLGPIRVHADATRLPPFYGTAQLPLRVNVVERAAASEGALY